MILNIEIKNRIATYVEGSETPVCGNGSDTVVFTFDAEWEGRDPKVARFIWGNQFHDEPFTENTCPVPMILNARGVEIGVFVEANGTQEAIASTRAWVDYHSSIRCGDAEPCGADAATYTIEARGYAEEAKAAAAEAAKYGFKVVGTFEDKCIYKLETSPQMFMDSTYKWYDEYEKSAGGRWFMVGASDPHGINFQNPQGYEDLLNLTKASTFITLHIKDSGASFANGDTEYKEVLGGLTSTFIFGDFRPSNENEVIDAVKERMPYVTNTRFVEVSTDEGDYLLVYLSDFVTSSMAYMYADGTAGGLLFTGYVDAANAERDCSDESPDSTEE